MAASTFAWSTAGCTGGSGTFAGESQAVSAPAGTGELRHQPPQRRQVGALYPHPQPGHESCPCLIMGNAPAQAQLPAIRITEMVSSQFTVALRSCYLN